MSNLRVLTNNKPRDVLYWYQLTDKERAEFDYIDTEVKQEFATFARYRRGVYDLGDFMRLDVLPEDSPLNGWHGYAGDSYFSGVLIRIVEDGERVIMGRWIQ